MKNCSLGIKEGFETLMSLKDNKTEGLYFSNISDIFQTCKPINSSGDIQKLYEHVQNAYLYMAMTDYPYASSFLQPMPGNPVNESCKSYKNVTVNDGSNHTLARM